MRKHGKSYILLHFAALSLESAYRRPHGNGRGCSAMAVAWCQRPDGRIGAPNRTRPKMRVARRQRSRGASAMDAAFSGTCGEFATRGMACLRAVYFRVAFT